MFPYHLFVRRRHTSNILISVLSICSIVPAAKGTADPSDFVRVAFVLQQQVEAALLKQQAVSLTVSQRRQYVIDRLKSTARDTQPSLIDDFERLRRCGPVHSYRPLWIRNCVIAEMDSASIEEVLVRHPEVAYAHRETCCAKTSAETRTLSQLDEIPWGLEDIQATWVWEIGYTGQGVLVACLDTGIDYEHPDLEDQIWVNPGEDINQNGVVDYQDWNGFDDDGNGYIDDLRGWALDLQSPEVMDEHGHGTAIAGIIAGSGQSGIQTGAAPEAQLMVLRNYVGGEFAFWEGLQYALQMGADFVVTSLSYKWHFIDKPDYATMRFNAETLEAAGLLMVCSPGNEGENADDPIPFNITSPGNCPPPWLHPDQTLTGATSAVLTTAGYTESYERLTYSGYGPSSWSLEDIVALDPTYPYQSSWPARFDDYPYLANQYMGLVKPDLCTPTIVATTAPGGGYMLLFNGSEAATGHLGGAVALAYSADPSASPADIAEAVMTTAVDMGMTGKDNTWGCGRLNIYRAVAELLEPYFGTVTGTVTDSITGDGIEDAEIVIMAVDLTTWSEVGGAYVLPGITPGTYTVRFCAEGYDTCWVDDISLATAEVESLDVALVQSVGVQPSPGAEKPAGMELLSVYPIPFNGCVTLTYELFSAGAVSIRIFNCQGRQIMEHGRNEMLPGAYKEILDFAGLPSGLYFYRLEVAGIDDQTSSSLSGKLVLLK